MGHRLYLAEWRAYLDKTQDQMAEAAGLAHRANFGRVERGEKNLSMDRLLQLAKALKINPGDFFYPPPTTTRTELMLNLQSLNDRDLEAVASVVRTFVESGHRKRA